MGPIKKLWNAPKNLVGYGLRFYKRVGKELVAYEVLTDLDRESFVSLCTAYHIMMVAQDGIIQLGATVKGSQDAIKKNPSFTTYKMASDIFERLSKRFYLTPRDRDGVTFKKQEIDNGKKKYFTAVG